MEKNYKIYNAFQIWAWSEKYPWLEQCISLQFLERSVIQVQDEVIGFSGWHFELGEEWFAVVDEKAIPLARPLVHNDLYSVFHHNSITQADKFVVLHSDRSTLFICDVFGLDFKEKYSAMISEKYGVI